MSVSPTVNPSVAPALMVMSVGIGVAIIVVSATPMLRSKGVVRVGVVIESTAGGMAADSLAVTMEVDVVVVLSDLAL
eukprot:8110789-Ditylum_brightwellii.AAC.1